MTGTTIAQAIPIAISPILTRLYTPEDFGIFALYMSISSILSVLATGRYELAIVLPEKDEDAFHLLILSVGISFLMTFMAFFFVLFFNTSITSLLGRPEIANWLYFIPVTIFLTGLYQSFSYWSNRKKEYRRLAFARIIQNGSTTFGNLGMGWGGYGSIGLIGSFLFGQGIASFFLGRSVFTQDRGRLRKIKVFKIIALAGKYSKFPKFDIPSAFIYSVYSNMALIFFSKFFEASVSGFYFFSNKILKIPLGIFVSAFSDVFYQKLSQVKEYENIAREINGFSLKILKTTFIPFLIIVYSSYFYVEPLFGGAWKELYLFIDIFALPVYTGLLLSPYGHILKIIDRQEISMYLHLFRLSVLSFFFISYFYMDYSLITFLYLYALLDAFLQLVLGWSIDYVINNKDQSFIILRLGVVFLIGWINFIIIF